jgi:hypothetical protein
VSTGRWAVLSFGFGSTISWEYCRFQRKTALEELGKMVQAQKSRAPKDSE